ncbi:hypothetical protein HPB51_005940 [Rhipicephalus microplus]|uniref:Caspase family p20 domain-containing protein n=1 Tax=Rhipicephalus microplus TaxID=6941 RepID=A0A9J6ERL5_RHIMP|nr:hypothetical protein HPB51_005940 [Rhipicephalus microplus]
MQAAAESLTSAESDGLNDATAATDESESSTQTVQEPAEGGAKEWHDAEEPVTLKGTSRYSVRPTPCSAAIMVAQGCGVSVYRMGLSPRGRCLIFNNVKFKYYKEPRFGSDHDKDRMEALFNAFLFKCDVYPDNEAHKMKELLAEAAQSEELASADCLVVIMMSHGDQNMIEGVDGDELHLVNDVYAQFNNDNCPALRGKPKLFFIQACRGGV